jgi:phosphatidylglycerol lysyltransferase
MGSSDRPESDATVDGSAEAAAGRSWSRWLQVAWPVFGLALLVAAGFLLHRELGGHHLADILAGLRGIPPARILLAAALAGASYWLLGFYDVLALRYVRQAVPYGRTLFTAFVSYAFGHNLGVATLTGGAIRYRMYVSSGLSATEVATVAGFCTLTSAIGLVSLISAALLLEPDRAAEALHLPSPLMQLAGSLLAALVLAYLVWASSARRGIPVRGWLIRAPGVKIALPQVALGAVDVGLAAAVLWVVLPDSAGIGLAAFAGLYAIATTAGLISHIPGGLGVFETVILLSLPQVPRNELLGALLAYRAVYYLLPLVLAALLFGVRELQAHTPRLSRAGALASAWVMPLVPSIAGSMVLVAGVLLLLSGATPALDSRLRLLRDILPLPVLEFSHMTGSVVGVGLVVLARALFRRSTAAYHMTLWLLGLGVAASLLKGLDFEEAFILGLVMGIVWMGRSGFYRRSPAFREPFSPAWTAAVVAVIALSAWVGFLANRHVSYSSELWWTFAFDGNAPRMLRALLVVSLIAASLLVASLLGTARFKPHAATADEIARARRLVAASDNSLANAVLIGDKQVLLSEKDDGFLMFQAGGRSWVALGDPVGASEAQEELAWRYHELADRAGARTVFYQASAVRLSLYVDLGLTALKIGEEARVPLDGFSLEGSSRAELRHARRRAERDGASFEVLPPSSVAQLLPGLRTISDEWLQAKSTAEKGFSIGRFSEPYLERFPLALVRRHGTPAAFANLWTTDTKAEFSVDLMRYGRDAPRDVMDYLFTELMMWGKQQGYRCFSLGMVPLAGLAQHPLAPAWNRIGNFVFRHGENFYNFEGLRHFKSKFLPAWEPRYLVAPGGLALPRILGDVSVLIAGGIREIVRK